MDADEPRKRKNYETKQGLNSLSIDELEDAVHQLNAEIDRLRREIDKKKADFEVAQSLFKS